MNSEPAGIAPEDKDWTYVLQDGCDQCGFAPDVPRRELGVRVRATLPRWSAALGRPDTRERPEPQVWSPLEYACHVRDVCRVMLGRLDLMLAHNDAQFENWDQDAAAVAERYGEQDPRIVLAEYTVAAGKLAARLDDVTKGQWERTGTRSNGSHFTVATLALYTLHELEHHLQDVGE